MGSIKSTFVDKELHFLSIKVAIYVKSTYSSVVQHLLFIIHYALFIIYPRIKDVFLFTDVAGIP